MMQLLYDKCEKDAFAFLFVFTQLMSVAQAARYVCGVAGSLINLQGRNLWIGYERDLYSARECCFISFVSRPQDGQLEVQHSAAMPRLLAYETAHGVIKHTALDTSSSDSNSWIGLIRRRHVSFSLDSCNI